MLTVITNVKLAEGIEAEWDELMQRRLAGARSAQGWVSGKILKRLDEPGGRVILGVWESRDAWAAWHDTPEFRATRERLAGLGADAGREEWHEAIAEAHR